MSDFQGACIPIVCAYLALFRHWPCSAAVDALLTSNSPLIIIAGSDLAPLVKALMHEDCNGAVKARVATAFKNHRQRAGSDPEPLITAQLMHIWHQCGFLSTCIDPLAPLTWSHSSKRIMTGVSPDPGTSQRFRLSWGHLSHYRLQGSSLSPE